MLDALLDPGLPTWLLVDPLLREPLPQAQAGACDSASEVLRRRCESWGREVQGLCVAAPTLEACQQPYLVALQSPRDPWLAHSLDMAKEEWQAVRADPLAGTGCGPHAVGGWLQTQTDGAALAASLQTLLRLKAPRRTEARYLRLADRRTLDTLDTLLGREHWTAAPGDIRRWVWLDSRGRLACAEMPVGQAAQHIHFDVPAWHDLQLAPLVHPTLARWGGAAPAAAQYEVPQAWRQASAAVQQAQRLAQQHPAHFSDAQDLVAYATLALLHPKLHEAPALQRWLALQPASDAFAPMHAYCPTLYAELAQTTDPKASA
jgi:hypothetical protein